MQKAIEHYHRRGLGEYKTPVGGWWSSIKNAASDAGDFVSDKAGDAYSWTSDVAGDAVDLAQDGYSWASRNYESALKMISAGGLLITGIATLNPVLIASGVSLGMSEADKIAKWVSSGDSSSPNPPAAPNLGMVLSSANSTVVNQGLKMLGFGFTVSKSGEPPTTVVTPDQIAKILPKNEETSKIILKMNGYKESGGSFLWLAALLPFLG